MAIVGVITARGGSKTIPRKSIAPCAGRPLIAYSCEAALGSASLDHVILSSDDAEIVAVARDCGVEAPFVRPARLATDTALMPEVLAHALRWFEGEGIEVEGVVLLQPTSPLRTARHIDEAVSLFREQRAETVVSLVEVPHNCSPNSLMKLDMDLRATRYDGSGELLLRKQDKPTVYARNGPAVLIMRPHLIHAGQLYGDPTVGYLMDRISSIDVDDPDDLFLADLVLQAQEQRSRISARA
ncbi:MAG: acylneuraminate cytidylyltransferase family protein [Alphaproteobacteria bacterium]|nr:acylneuraminate cytidylyltransferase family protein [Alphaproteobacteria bacterium]